MESVIFQRNSYMDSHKLKGERREKNKEKRKKKTPKAYQNSDYDITSIIKKIFMR
jgi:hypothetical protein